ncbi:hypothetical protein KOW79_016207 [Hemibagrus wyckioides]|uniref:Uncharacterized protein n=1 Tax=Hemibagrus wyckioides TaxID=337641 RepID=A0A9D3NF10_9TELE|nr:hypothetical protein KOW79_016207 [Hemibagrus wyckioides]
MLSWSLSSSSLPSEETRVFDPLCTWTCPSKDGHRLNIFSPQGQDLVWQLLIAQAEHSKAKAEVVLSHDAGVGQ